MRSSARVRSVGGALPFVVACCLAGESVVHGEPDAVVLLHERAIELASDGAARTRVHRVVEIRTESGSRRFREASVLYEPQLGTAELIELGRLEQGAGGTSDFVAFDTQAASQRSAAPGGLEELHIRLPLCRPGQCVTYTVELTQRPPFGDHFSSVLLLGDEVPVERSRLVLNVARGGRVFWRAWGCRVQPAVEREALVTRYCWEHDERVEPLGPAPRIFVSNTRKWRPVRDWIAERFAAALAPTPAVRAATAEVCGPGEARGEAVDRLLRFVREEIDEPEHALGPSPFEPQRPDETLESRMGDCKAKAALLASMLKAMEINATPCLLDLRSGVPLDQQLPSPYVFSHACLGVRLDNRRIWVDPTESAPPYHPGHDFRLVGLVLDPTAKPLERLSEVLTSRLWPER